MSVSVTLKLLGSCAIRYNGNPVTDLPNKALALLVYLAMKNSPQRRTHVAGILWSELGESSALANLRKVIHAVRTTDSVSGCSVIDADRQSLCLSSAADIAVDALLFETALDQEKIGKEDMLSTISLYDGEFLKDFYLRGADGFSDWQNDVQARFHHKYILALNQLSSLHERQGDLEQAIFTTHKLLSLEPLREDLYLRQMQLYNLNGQRADAIALYGHCEKILQTELSASPAPCLSEFYNKLKYSHNSNSLEQVAIATSLQSRTPHQHKFIIGPPVGNPAQFFGRENHLTRIFGWWQQPPFGHVALIGPRRSGKTSLLHHLQPISGQGNAEVRANQKSHWLKDAAYYSWVSINFQDPRMRTLSSLLRHLLAGFNIESPSHCTLEMFMELATEKTWNTPTLILIDELEAGLAADDLEQSFWWTLRSLTQMTDGYIGIVMASHEQPMKAADAADKTSPFFNIFSTLEIGPLEPLEAVEFIANIDRPFSDKDQQWILEQSGCWPCLLQILCQENYFAIENNIGSNRWRENALRQLEDYGYLPR